MEHLIVYKDCTADSGSHSKAQTDFCIFGSTGKILCKPCTIHIIFHLTGKLKPLFHGLFDFRSRIIRNQRSRIGNLSLFTIHHTCSGNADSYRLILLYILFCYVLYFLHNSGTAFFHGLCRHFSGGEKTSVLLNHTIFYRSTAYVNTYILFHTAAPLSLSENLFI